MISAQYTINTMKFKLKIDTILFCKTTKLERVLQNIQIMSKTNLYLAFWIKLLLP